MSSKRERCPIVMEETCTYPELSPTKPIQFPMTRKMQKIHSNDDDCAANSCDGIPCVAMRELAHSARKNLSFE